MIIGRSRWIIVIALGALACGPLPGDELDELDERDELDDPSPRAWDDNGFRLNGFRLNGFRLNGLRLSGGVLSGEGGDTITLKKIVLPGAGLLPIRWVHEGELRAWSPREGALTGADLIGARLHFKVEEGGVQEHRRVRIVGATPPSAGSSTWLYDLDLNDPPGGWKPLCVDDEGAREAGILITDLWDPITGDRVRPLPSGAVTFACLGGALAKCARWGYLPWGSVGDTPLAEYHQACTRAVRADFCGDGTPHTIEGTEIHVLDQLGIEPEAPGGGYSVEAEWGPDGATCLNLDVARHAGDPLACGLPPCGAPFESGGLIQTGTVSGG